MVLLKNERNCLPITPGKKIALIGPYGDKQNVFGKWCQPNYNSAVATFCHNIARGLPVTVSDPARAISLVYIDDIVAEFVRALAGKPTPGEAGFYTA